MTQIKKAGVSLLSFGFTFFMFWWFSARAVRPERQKDLEPTECRREPYSPWLASFFSAVATPTTG